jgi:hypothetical protein
MELGNELERVNVAGGVFVAYCEEVGKKFKP